MFEDPMDVSQQEAPAAIVKEKKKRKGNGHTSSPRTKGQERMLDAIAEATASLVTDYHEEEKESPIPSSSSSSSPSSLGKRKTGIPQVISITEEAKRYESHPTSYETGGKGADSMEIPAPKTSSPKRSAVLQDEERGEMSLPPSLFKRKPSPPPVSPRPLAPPAHSCHSPSLSDTVGPPRPYWVKGRFAAVAVAVSAEHAIHLVDRQLDVVMLPVHEEESYTPVELNMSKPDATLLSWTTTAFPEESPPPPTTSSSSFSSARGKRGNGVHVTSSPSVSPSARANNVPPARAGKLKAYFTRGRVVGVAVATSPEEAKRLLDRQLQGVVEPDSTQVPYDVEELSAAANGPFARLLSYSLPQD
jgi:hypothetical protein